MELIDIGGRRLATWSSGNGSPVVILETGLGAPASDWETVHEGVASFTKVCHYDRANCGQSDAAPTPRTSLDMAEDLHALIGAAGFDTPVILVGHSFGGPISIVYAHRWPSEVAGLVLADPAHPEQFTSIGPIMPDFLPMKEFWTNGWLTPEGTAERIDFHTSFDQVNAVDSLGDLPVRILTSSTWAGLDEAQEIWVGLHGRYAQLSTSADQQVLEGTNHFLQRCAPAAIVEAIEEMIRGR
ncbi:MAG: hypothetical protein QOG54_1412 [Actinomycetota bacterium]|jgi:pimeloyl-ACP methyl ester carboxylesterase|nr:hypothetical protein [Actinomycetota bacterium]